MRGHIRLACSILVPAMLACSASSSRRYTPIDDMEGPSNQIIWQSSFGTTRGYWFSTTDCAQADRIDPQPTTPAANPWSYAVLPESRTLRGAVSTHAARLRTITPLVGGWGAYMGVAFAGTPHEEDGASPATDAGDGDAGAPTTGQPCKQGTALDYPNTATSDLSAYSGITFWAMADQRFAKTIRVQLNDWNTDPRQHLCNAADPTSDTDCYNAFGTSLVLTDTFTQYTVDFASLYQKPSWGFHPAGGLDIGHVYNLDFAVDQPDCTYTMCAGGPPSLAFDFWIDDLSFVDR